MGRAQGQPSAAAAGPQRRRRTSPRLLSAREDRLVHAAHAGDFQLYLDVAQALGNVSEALLDGEATDTVCGLAIARAHADHAQSLDERLAAAGVGTPAVRTAIVRAVSHQASHDLRFALYKLVERQSDLPRTPRVGPDELAEQARALLANRVGEALDEPMDLQLLGGDWPALRDC
jgi:hypothetical protein